MKKSAIIVTIIALIASVIPIYAIFDLRSGGDSNLLITLAPTSLIVGGVVMGIVKIRKKVPKAAIIYSAISLLVSAIVYYFIIDTLTK